MIPDLPRAAATLLAATSIVAALPHVRADVFINEFMANNPGRPNDPNAQLDMDLNSPGWVELRNDGAVAVALTGWALSDDPANPGKWIFAAPIAPATVETTIPANGYKLVYCGGFERNIANVEPHTSFKIDDSGEILLSLPDGLGGWTVVSQIGTAAAPYPNQRKGISYGFPSNDKSQVPVFFESDTPGAANGASGVTAFCKDTVFSVDRGFYDAPFSLSITCATPGATIVYTLNGTQPSPTNGIQAAAPDALTPPTATLTINGTTIVRARAHGAGLGMSNVDTQTYLFAAQVLTQAGPLPTMGLTANDTFPWGTSGASLRTPPGPDWAVDPNVVNNANIANRFTADDLKHLPVVSVVTAWREAFGPNSSAPDFATTPINNRGFYVGPEISVPKEGTDRAASMEYINPLGDAANPNPHQDTPTSPWINKGFQIDGNIHVFGGTSEDRWKSYKLSMRFKCDQNVNFNIYGDDASPDQDLYVLDARLNQSWVHGTDATQRSRADYVRDHVMADLQNAMGGNTFHTKPVHYFLDGLYWGLYLLHEKPDDNFQATYRGGGSSEWDVFKHSAKNGVDGGTLFNNVIGTALLDPTKPLGSATDPNYFNTTTLKNYEDLMDLVGIGRVAPNSVPDLTIQANYEAVAAKLDIPDFIKYVLLNAVAANTDWPHKNYYASYKRTDPNAKWRFHSWDAEHVFRQESENTFTQGNWNADTGGAGAIMRRLVVNPEFRLAFADIIHKHLFNNGILSTAALQAAFNKRFAEVDPGGIRGESARWGDNRSPANAPYTYTTNSTGTPTWTAEKTRILNTVIPGRAGLGATPTTTALNQMRAFTVSPTVYPLYPTVVAPEFRNNATDTLQHGGSVPANFALKIFNGNSGGAGTIYFTLDGSDPREMWTSNPSATAQTYAAPITLNSSLRVKSRINSGTTWSALDEAYFSVATTPASAANLVVSQIHYHPSPPSASELAAGFNDTDGFEYVELMNISSNHIDLSGVNFGAGLDFQFDDGALIRDLAAGQRVLIVKKRDAFALRYGGGLPVAGEFLNLSGLSNGGERLQILDKNGATIKDFAYNDKAPWPLTADGEGPALVLRQPLANPDHNDPANWRASVAAALPNADDALHFAAWRVAQFTPVEAVNDAISGRGGP
jgi:CotH kinase protein/Chitobiase/beta-hexosaminidase C-terminal domain